MLVAMQEDISKCFQHEEEDDYECFCIAVHRDEIRCSEQRQMNRDDPCVRLDEDCSGEESYLFTI